MIYIQNVKSLEYIRQSIKNNLDLMGEDIKTIFLLISLAVGYVRSIGIRTLHCISGVVRRYWDKYIESYEEALSSFVGTMEYCNQISPCLFSLHTHPLNSLHLIV
jgi:hypothetical protein